MQAPIIIQRGNRKAVICNDRVALLKRHNKHKDTGVWPETPVPGEFSQLHAALTWVINGFIELPGTR